MTISNDQRLQRKAGIGGSDAPIIANVSPWKTRLELYFDKITTDDIYTEPNLPMQIGTALEPVILNEFGNRYGCVVREATQTFVNQHHGFVRGHIDGFFDEGGKQQGVESKWVANLSDDWGETGTDHVPPYVMLQCVHYMLVTGWDTWHVAALFGGREFRYYTIHRNELLVRHLLEMEIDFWDMVQTRTPPPLTDPIDAKLLYTKDNGQSIIADPATMADWFTLNSMKNSIAEMEQQIEEVQSRIQAYMGENSTMTDNLGNVLATWKNSKPAVRFDANALKSEMPDLYSRFLTAGNSSRRFLLKKGK